MVNQICDRLRAAQSRQKSYYDIKRKALELEIGDKVFLRVVPMKGVMRFGKNGKLSPRFVGPLRSWREWVKLHIKLPYHRPCQEFIMFSMSLC